MFGVQRQPLTCIAQRTKSFLKAIYEGYKSTRAMLQPDYRTAEQERKKLRSAPQPLPNQRERGLSLLPQSPQSVSLFLTRLPLEIRQEIYNYIVGGNLVHVVRKGQHLAHVRCKPGREFDYQRDCRPYASYTCHSAASSMGFTANGNTALLRTCRQVYAEAVRIMYSHNTFDFDHQDLFLLFSRSLLPQRLRAIRILHLYCKEKGLRWPFLRTGAGPSAWCLTWQVIKDEMPGLQHLRVKIIGEQGSSYPSEDLAWWVRPMLQVRGLKSFHLEFRAASNNWVEFGDGVFEMSRLLEERIRSVVCSEASDGA
ncbi:MAG: hypothetical protein Q9200_000950 [Gallowayella weberi]